MNLSQISTSTQKSTKPKFRFFFPRKNNESYPNNEYHKDASLISPLPTIRELKIVNDIFNAEVIDDFSKVPNNDRMEILFVMKILRKVFDSYNEVCFYVIEKVPIIVNGQSKLINQLVDLDYKQAIQRSINYLRNKKWKIKQSNLKVKKNNESKLNHKEVIEYTSEVYKFYSEHELFDNVPETNWYSCIHSLYESFQFILFDRSHQVKPNVPIHECTRIKLIFPNNVNMMLLFHGHLAHNGASSLYENDLQSFNYQNSLRLFSYVDKVSETNKVTNARVNTRSNGYHISKQSADGKIEHKGTRECNNCTRCMDFLNKNIKHWKYFGTRGLGHFSIDLLKCYNEAKKEKLKFDKSSKKRKLDSDSDEPLLIAGNLEKHGWAVYEGISVIDHDYPKLHDELCNSLDGRGFLSKWKTIHKDGGECQYLKIHEKLDKFKTLDTFFDKIELNIRRLNGFEKSGFQKPKRLILRNKGNTQEQEIHRDQTNES